MNRFYGDEWDSWENRQDLMDRIQYIDDQFISPNDSVRVIIDEIAKPFAEAFRVNDSEYASGMVHFILEKLGQVAQEKNKDAPHVAANLLCAAADLVAEPVSHRTLVAYRNRHQTFVDDLARYTREVQSYNQEPKEFYAKLGKQIALKIFEKELVNDYWGPQPKPKDFDEVLQAANEQLVYFVGAGTDGPIKIGIAKNPTKRLSELQTGNPYKLQLLAMTTGGRDQEAQYHEFFRTHRLQGEWFERHPDLLDEIQRVNEQSPQLG